MMRVQSALGPNWLSLLLYSLALNVLRRQAGRVVIRIGLPYAIIQMTGSLIAWISFVVCSIDV